MDTPRFVADCMLGRLARWLRILGWDTWYFREISDAELLDLHRTSGRVLLTRDTRLVRSPGIGAAVLIRDDHWQNQILEVLRALALRIDAGRILTRCVVCNGVLSGLSADEARGRIPDYVLGTQTRFHVCCRCRKIYWGGTHRRHILNALEGLTQEKKRSGEGTSG
ncbi:MAG: Mut7-C RNAse domain-containing protein [bacterium]